MSDNIVTASEMVGEFRKLSRFYEVLSSADKVLQVLVEAEKRQVELNASLEEYQVELEKVKVETEANKEAAKKAVQKAKASEDIAAAIIAEADKQKAALIEAAQTQAFDEVAKIQKNRDQLLSEVAILEGTKKNLEVAVGETKAKLDSLEGQVSSTRAKLLEIING